MCLPMACGNGGGVVPKGTLFGVGGFNAGQAKSAGGLLAGPSLGEVWGSVFLYRQGSWVGAAPPAQGQSQSSVTLSAMLIPRPLRTLPLAAGMGMGAGLVNVQISCSPYPSLFSHFKKDYIFTSIN